MARALEDVGHALRFNKPFMPQLCQEGRLPDPVQCAGGIILIVNRNDGNSLYTAQSDGSRWRRLKFADDEPSQAVAARPSEIDLTPLVREAVAAMLPSLQHQIKVVQAPAQLPAPQLQQVVENPDVAALANALLELSQHMNSLMNKNAELEARIENVERRAVDVSSVELRRIG